MKPHTEWATPTTAADNNTTTPLFWIRPSHLTWHWEEQYLGNNQLPHHLSYPSHLSSLIRPAIQIMMPAPP